MIPCLNPHTSYLAHRVAIDAAVQRVLQSGRYILSDEVAAFENEFAAVVNSPHTIGVASGTDALWLALRACDIGPGDEVITVAHTAVATVAAICQTGATPVFVDIHPQHFTIDVDAIARALTPRTRAIVPVHLYGRPAHLAAICDHAKKHQLRVIEDCAQAMGARWQNRHVGTVGDCGCFSFYPTKNLGACGDGGMIVTRDAALAKKMRALREYGWETRYVSESAGWNSRLDAMQAAILRAKIPHLAHEIERRRHIAQQYTAALHDRPIHAPAADDADLFAAPHLYVVTTPQRDVLQAHLALRGIATAIHYPIPIHQQPAYRHLAPAGGLHVTERIAKNILTLPLFPELPDADVAHICAVLQEWRS